MKTNQIMTRNLGGFEIQQRTLDGFFDGNALLQKWNAQTDIPSSKRREMKRFLDSSNTKEFLEALAIDENKRMLRDSKSPIAKMRYGVNQLVIKASGRNTSLGRTPDRVWMHPLLFVKFAMWLNPTFEVQVLRFVMDKMLEYRDEAGEAYKAMSTAVAKISDSKDIRNNISKVAEAVNFIVFGKHELMIRNQNGDEKLMRELFDMERTVAFVVNEGFIRDYETLMEYLRNQWRKKYASRA